MLPLQKRYAKLLGRTLKRFKQIKPDLFNYRCPYCGDSDKSETKARGYLFLAPDRQGLIHKCHNCGVTAPFQKLIQDHDEALYRQYLADLLKHRDGFERDRRRSKAYKESQRLESAKERKTERFLLDNGATAVGDLENDHRARVYLSERLIDGHHWSRIYYTDQMKKFIHRVDPEKFKRITNDTPAIIFPLLDRDGQTLNGFQCRNLDPSDDLRYITIKVRNAPRYYGWHRFDKDSEPTYVIEGAIDSLMLPAGALAVCGSDLLSAYFENATYIFDNEPRNKQIVQKIEQAVAAGCKVCLLPEEYYKMDLNDIVRNGLVSKDALPELIKTHTSSGLRAQMNFSQWRKI